jgi:hypothetical protein
MPGRVLPFAQVLLVVLVVLVLLESRVPPGEALPSGWGDPNKEIVHPITAHRGRGQLRAIARG